MNIDELFNSNNSILEYWNLFNLTKSNFYCRECGKMMLDINDIINVEYSSKRKDLCKLHYIKHANKQYVESECNRWLVRGRTLSNKTYFRKICWDCFFKHLSEIEDIPRRARKSSWYRDINNGILRPPATCTSPSKYFKLLFDINDFDLEKEREKFDTASLNSFVRRYGKSDGPVMYKNYIERQAYTCSKDYMINEKGFTEKEWNEYNANRACTKENFINRYGKELGLEKWYKYCETEAYVGCKLEYFIEKYGKVEGIKKYIELNKKKYNSLENFISKYGEDEGKKKWAEYSHKPYSDESQDLFRTIDEIYGEYAKINSKWCTKNGEATIILQERGLQFHPDYMLDNKIIEFNGDYWHGNPKMYKSGEIINMNGKNIIVDTLWNKDKKRILALKECGYDTLIIWEDDYLNRREETIKKCIDFLTQKLV